MKMNKAMREAIATAVKEALRDQSSRGGKKGGPARAAALSPERRKEIARKAAIARWGEKKGQ